MYIDSMARMNQYRRMTETIQRAIRESGLSLNEVGRRAGVDTGQMSRFMRDERSMTLPKIERLCALLGLELCPVEKGKKAKVR